MVNGTRPPCSEAEVWQALRGVPDPELPALSVVELGIVRDVRLEGGRATLTITPTFSACPALHTIRAELARAVEALGLEPRVETVLFPPWSSDLITPEARRKLEDYGIAPPTPGGSGGLLQLQADAPRCPRCGSLNTGVKNTFGPTLCKSLHVCNACGEPFEAFKTV